MAANKRYEWFKPNDYNEKIKFSYIKNEMFPLKHFFVTRKRKTALDIILISVDNERMRTYSEIEIA